MAVVFKELKNNCIGNPYQKYVIPSLWRYMKLSQIKYLIMPPYLLLRDVPLYYK